MISALETERLVLRVPEARDWEPFRDFMMSERAAPLSGPHDLGPSWRMFAAEIGHWAIRGYGMWVLVPKGSDKGVGLVGPWYPADWPETEIGWMIWTDAAEGKGYAREAARAAIDHAWNVLKWGTAVSYVANDNHRSAALAERLGARLDPGAPQPRPDAPCRVFRHPKPGAA